jgi:hypothetical protein
MMLLKLERHPSPHPKASTTADRGPRFRREGNEIEDRSALDTNVNWFRVPVLLPLVNHYGVLTMIDVKKRAEIFSLATNKKPKAVFPPFVLFSFCSSPKQTEKNCAI